MRAIVWTSKPLARACARFFPGASAVGSAREFLDAPRDAKTISFVDESALEDLDRLAVVLGAAVERPPELRKLLAAVSLGPVVALSERPSATAIGWLHNRPWLSHVISGSMLEDPIGEPHLASLFALLDTSREPQVLDFVDPAPEGRRVRLTHSNRRGQRLERMLEFYRSKNVDADLIDRVREIANILMVNAFYDAPSAVGVTAPRGKDVALPADLACELVYGYRKGVAFLRVRDPFGSLTREHVDGGLGRPTSGLAQVFSAASVVAVSVVTHQRTDILVELREPPAALDAFAFHLFFKPGPRRGMWRTIDDETGDPNSPTSSISIIVE